MTKTNKIHKENREVRKDKEKENREEERMDMARKTAQCCTCWRNGWSGFWFFAGAF